MEWLNGPLVWAIAETHEPMYLFPRECPRILLWPTPETTEADYTQWFGENTARFIAYIETAWLDRVRRETMYRYEMPAGQFEDIDDAGMWVSRLDTVPLNVVPLHDLPHELAMRKVELRALDRLTPLKNIWQTTLHASGIRLRNAQDWGKPGWTHLKRGRVVIVQ
jgi:hypothetical protein